jgi:thiol-disulfide isomerase/thioredoxin
VRIWAGLVWLGACGLFESPEPVAPLVQVVQVVPAQGDLNTLLMAEAMLAGAEGRVAYAQIYADWCAPCVSLRDSMDDPLMREAFLGVHVVRLDVDAWRPQLLRMLRHPNQIPVPAFYEIDPVGGLGRSIDGHAWGENVAGNMAPPLQAFFRQEGPGVP